MASPATSIRRMRAPPSMPNIRTPTTMAIAIPMMAETRVAIRTYARYSSGLIFMWALRSESSSCCSWLVFVLAYLPIVHNERSWNCESLMYSGTAPLMSRTVGGPSLAPGSDIFVLRYWAGFTSIFLNRSVTSGSYNTSRWRSGHPRFLRRSVELPSDAFGAHLGLLVVLPDEFPDVPEVCYVLRHEVLYDVHPPLELLEQLLVSQVLHF